MIERWRERLMAHDDALTQLLRERRKLAQGEEDNFNVLDTKQLADTRHLDYWQSRYTAVMRFEFASAIFYAIDISILYSRVPRVFWSFP